MGMLYSIAYKKHYPIQSENDISVLDEKERKRLAKCIRSFPRLLQAWSIDAMRKIKIEKTDDFSGLGANLAELRKECVGLYDKIMGGCVLSEEEVRALNMALFAQKYNCFLEILIPSRSHLERLYWYILWFSRESE